LLVGRDSPGIPCIVLAGAGSRTGKTTITTGVMASLRARGLGVKPFKIGPDFADSRLLSQAAGCPSRTLDSWLLGADATVRSFHSGSIDGDVAVVEGMLGLHDSWGSPADSTAGISRLLGAPVVLVLDVFDTMQSAAAIASGFKSVDPGVRIAGVILNRVHDADHARVVEEATWKLARVPVLGTVPVMEPGTSAEEVAAVVARCIDVDVLLQVAARRRGIPRPPEPAFRPPGTRVRLGVAYDEAFDLYYPENLELLSDGGAEIIPFSPLVDHGLPDVDGVYMAGAASERHAEALAANGRMRASIRDAHNDGVPIYAECGGLTYLSERLLDASGASHEMVGLLPFTAAPEAGERRVGYRRLRPLQDCLIAPRGRELRGYEFHWSRLGDATSGVRHAYELSDPHGYISGHEGYIAGRLLASNIHVHFGQDPSLASSLLDACRERAGAVLA
jgi:cobyrinic acid a,c-diamide synthase